MRERDANISLPPGGFQLHVPLEEGISRSLQSTQTHTTQFLIVLYINVSTNQFNLSLSQSLKRDRKGIPQGNLTVSIYMKYKQKENDTHPHSN